MNRDPWHNASFTLEIAYDALILAMAIFGTCVGIHLQIPVMVFGGAIFIATAICWLIADVWRAIKSNSSSIETAGPEVGVTFLLAEKSLHVCFYTCHEIVMFCLYRRK